MKKKNKTLIILVIVLAVLCGSYIGVLKYKEFQDQKQQEASEAEEAANKIVLNQMDSITRISFQTADGQLAFHFQDGVWYYDADPAFPLDESKMNLIVNNLNPLEAVRKLEEKEDLSNYGLTEPGKTVTVTDASGNQKILNIGNVNEYTGDFYVNVAGDENVYTIGSVIVDSLDVTLDELLKLDSIPYFNESNIMQIEWKTNTENVLYKKEERTEETEPTTETTELVESQEETSKLASETKTVWTETRNGVVTDLKDSSKITDAISMISQLTIDSSENYNVSAEQLASYGLDEANRKTLTITYNDTASEDGGTKTMNLYIGTVSAADNAYYCVKVDESTQVSRMKASAIDGIAADLQQVGEPVEVTVPETSDTAAAEGKE